MKILCIFLFLSASVSGILSAEIVIKEDQKGRVVITDTGVNPFLARLDRIQKNIRNRSNPPQSSKSDFSNYYRSKIRALCQQLEFREDLAIAVARAESGFNPYAVSHKGASGIMQLMKETARLYGVGNLFNADENIEGGVKHLKYLYNKYKENIPLTLAAYNAGEEAVAKYNGIPPYRETRQYIHRVLQYMGMGYLYPSTSGKSIIYRYVNAEGRIIISDTKPSSSSTRFEIIE